MSVLPNCPPHCPCPLACLSDPDDAYDDEEPSTTEIEEDQPCAP
jgi:hypothetical protein